MVGRTYGSSVFGNASTQESVVINELYDNVKKLQGDVALLTYDIELLFRNQKLILDYFNLEIQEGPPKEESYPRVVLKADEGKSHDR